ncbi:MAG: hypothetical protein IJC71_05260, partial [Clostridia bacterium]|nr:hypothetical protein [Clostridia bacterium]
HQLRFVKRFCKSFFAFFLDRLRFRDPLSSLVDSLYIVSHLIRFVKGFYKSFLGFFSFPLLSLRFCAIAVVSR